VSKKKVRWQTRDYPDKKISLMELMREPFDESEENHILTPGVPYRTRIKRDSRI
jgi:hypothetical protein